jgi:hypothetical protein
VSGKQRDFGIRHNRTITNYVGPGPLLLQEFTSHIAGTMLPKIPKHLVEYQDEVRRKKSNVTHFFQVLSETYSDSNISSKLANLLDKAFTNSKIEETQITPIFLQDLMDALDLVKGTFDSGSPDRAYLDKLISTIYDFYKLLKYK